MIRADIVISVAKPLPPKPPPSPPQPLPPQLPQQPQQLLPLPPPQQPLRLFLTLPAVVINGSRAPSYTADNRYISDAPRTLTYWSSIKLLYGRFVRCARIRIATGRAPSLIFLFFFAFFTFFAFFLPNLIFMTFEKMLPRGRGGGWGIGCWVGGHVKFKGVWGSHLGFRQGFVLEGER